MKKNIKSFHLKCSSVNIIIQNMFSLKKIMSFTIFKSDDLTELNTPTDETNGEDKKKDTYDLHDDIWDISMEHKKQIKKIKKERKKREQRKTVKQTKNKNKKEYDLHNDIWYRCKENIKKRDELHKKILQMQDNELKKSLFDKHQNMCSNNAPKRQILVNNLFLTYENSTEKNDNLLMNRKVNLLGKIKPSNNITK